MAKKPHSRHEQENKYSPRVVFKKIMNNMTLAAIIGFIFDSFNLLLSMTDAYSDAAVALEFRDSGRTGFFYACAIVFVLGMVSDSFAFVAAMDSSKNGRLAGVKFFLAVVFLSPFAHVLPLVNFFMTNANEDFNNFTNYSKTDWDKDPENYWISQSHNRQRRARAATTDESVLRSFKQLAEEEEEEKDGNSEKSTASQEIIKTHTSSSDSLIAKMDQAAVHRQRTMMVINIQTLVESLPQSIIQLIAISLTEQPTKTQVFSLSLSLVSIAAKFFMLSRSWKLEAFIGKMLFLIHDLFSLAFLSSAVFMKSIPGETTFFFGYFEVTYLTWWWVTIKCFTVVIGLVTAIAIFIEDVYRFTHNPKERFKQMFIFTSFTILGFVPVVIIQEGLKLSYLFLLSKTKEPDPKHFPTMPYLHHFLWGGGDSQEKEGQHHNQQENKIDEFFLETTDWNATFNNLRKQMFSMLDIREKNRKQLYSGTHYYPTPDQQFFNFRQRMRKCRVVRQDFDATSYNDLMAMKNPTPDCTTTHDENTNASDKHIQREGFLVKAKYCFLVSYFNRIKNVVERDTYSTTSQLRQRMLDEENIDGHPLSLEKQQELCLPGFSWFNFVRQFFPHRFFPKNFDLEKFLKFQMSWTEIRRDLISGSVNHAGDQFIFSFMILCAIPFLCALTGLLGLFFPILHYFWYSEQYWTLMQHITFWPAMFALFLSIPLLPSCFKYVLTSAVAEQACILYRDEIFDLIDTYRSVPVSALKFAVFQKKQKEKEIENEQQEEDKMILPEDAVDKHVLPFLTSSMVGLYGLGAKEYSDLMKSMKK